MGLFTDLYQTVAKFFRPQEDIEGDASKSVATNRLKLVLMQDRTNLTPKILEQMRGELVDLLSKYLEMDKDLLELNFEHEGDQVALMLSIPVIRAKDEEEIEEAIKASKANETEEDSEENEETDEETTVEEAKESVTEADTEAEGEVVSEEVEASAEDEVQNSEEEEEEIVPKRKRTKKVSAPENLNTEDGVEETEAETVVEE